METSSPLTIGTLLESQDDYQELPDSLIPYVLEIQQENNHANFNLLWTRGAPMRGTWMGRRRQTEIPLLNQLRGCLNKISGDNYAKITDKLLRLLKEKVSCKKQLEEVASLIQSKAISDSPHCPLYGRLCRELAPCFVKEEEGKIHFVKNIPMIFVL